MKKALPIVLAAAGLASLTATPALAIDGLSANAAVTTNYVFRGISQSGANIAAQAGLDYNIPGVSGLAVGTWVSSIDFGNAFGEDTPVEWDIYGSYTYAINDKFSLSVGGIHYTYPNSPHAVNYNWYEGWVGASYNFGFATVGGKVYYSPDYVNLSTHQFYYTAGVTVPVVPWLSLSANIGHTDLDHSVFPLIKDYTDWNVSAAATYENFTLTVGYADTDLDGAYEVKSGAFQTTAQLFVMLSFKLP